MPATDTPGASRSDAERNRRTLLNAAAEALAQNPGASMAQVAEAAGLTRATLYRHFSTRQKLLEAMRAEALERAAEAISGARLAEGDALEALRRAVDALAPTGVRFRALLAEGADQDPSFLGERAEVFAPLAEAVRRGQEAGRIRADVSPAWVVTAMAALLVAGVRTAPATDCDGHSVADVVFGTLTQGVVAKG
ncbi:TetR/AcrR family transcriptional regulator [Streptomyces sp. GC420]|uniref:TetR/AcrR family transcriptional regulator n=1 Tax=Streptomyces sp. GC420 TaxID=2697568 RepID=UPI0014152931|nr:TetR/AcrR family transcriptional regulator [Streptomyces sp. GC420]NBM19459.1 TetR family transcriptional regulator [Streptomyces sp. GC420]